MRQDSDSCIIEPRRGRNEDPLPHSAILVFNPEDLCSFLDCFAHPAKRSRKLYLSDIYIGDFKGTQIAIAGPMLGAPQAILILERMIAMGARHFIATGWCGSLQTHVRIGDIVLPADAISEEGTSQHYPKCAATPSPHLQQSIERVLETSGMPVHHGTVWTTDAPFRETVSKVKKFQSEGVLAVEMETSALFTVAAYRGIDLAVVLVVSDDLSEFKWRHGFREPVFKEARQKAVDSTLQAVCLAAASLTHS